MEISSQQLLFFRKMLIILEIKIAITTSYFISNAKNAAWVYKSGLVLTSTDFFRVDLRVFRAGTTVVTGVEAAFLLDRVRRAPSSYSNVYTHHEFGFVSVCVVICVFIFLFNSFQFVVIELTWNLVFVFLFFGVFPPRKQKKDR